MPSNEPPTDATARPRIAPADVALLFDKARTFGVWQPDKQIAPEVLRDLWRHAAFGPTSYNCSPLRLRFVVSKEAKERLIPHLMEGNVEKVRTAPVTVIFAHDENFHERFPALFPGMDLQPLFTGDEKKTLRQSTSFRNGSLQAAYFMLAARAHGFDCGPMSGFNNDGVDAEFFAGTSLKSNFLCNVGHGDASALHPRLPRLGFDEVAEIL